MRISKDTIEALKTSGIEVKPYPTSFEDFYKRLYDGYYNFHKSEIGSEYVLTSVTELTPDGHPTEKSVRKDAKYHADFETEFGRMWYGAETLYIEYEGRLIAKRESVKSKVITEDYVKSLVEKDKKLYNGTYGHFCELMQKVSAKKGWNKNFTIYPTTYGIGIFIFWCWNFDKYYEEVETFLKEYGIEFTTEYSRAHWVFRFRLSKKAGNLTKIERAVA